MRRGDRQHAFRRCGSAASIHVLPQRLAQFRGFIRVSSAGMRGFSERRRSECALYIGPPLLEIFILEESSAAQRVEQMRFELACAHIAGDANQVRAQIQPAVLAIKKFQAAHQRGRYDQRGI
jgi:hypothetical protein